MDCCRQLCFCLLGRESLFGPRRTPLSVSVHDDDWDAEVGFENNTRKARTATELKNEMQLQMQHMSKSITRSMQNVSVTEEDEEYLGSTNNTSSSQQLKSSSWRGDYKSTPMNSVKDGHDSSDNNNETSKRETKRDVPYTDKTPLSYSQAVSNTINTNQTVKQQQQSITSSDSNSTPNQVEDDNDEEVEISLL